MSRDGPPDKITYDEARATLEHHLASMSAPHQGAVKAFIIASEARGKEIDEQAVANTSAEEYAAATKRLRATLFAIQMLAEMVSEDDS